MALQPPYLLGFKESVQAQPRDTVVPLLGNLAVGINDVTFWCRDGFQEAVLILHRTSKLKVSLHSNQPVGFCLDDKSPPDTGVGTIPFGQIPTRELVAVGCVNHWSGDGGVSDANLTECSHPRKGENHYKDQAME